MNQVEEAITTIKNVNSIIMKPDRSYCFARQTSMNVLIEHWEKTLVDFNQETIDTIIDDIYETVDDLEEYKKNITVDIDLYETLIENKEKTVSVIDNAKNAALSVLAKDWIEQIQNPFIHKEGTAISTMKSTMDRDILYTRADLLKIKAIMKVELDKALQNEVEAPTYRP